MESDYLMKKRQQGVTLIEMMITVGIVGILVGVVAPSISTIMTKNNITADINELSGLLQQARFTAVDQQAPVIVCPSADYSTCSTDWNDAKIAFIDTNANGVMDGTEILLSSTDAIASNVLSSDGDVITFLESGGLTFGTASARVRMTLCPDNGDETFARGIVVNRVGRIQISKDSNDDGIHETAGIELSC